VPAGEQCEDGNTAGGDGCGSTCRIEGVSLTVVKLGTGSGTVTSAPAGIN
jgi:cysteine-rich repeat protein